MKVNTIDKEVKEILSSDFYQIPRFQRPYSWDRENISEFWNDAIEESDQDYFIGAVVAFKGKDGVYGIVDGQQRLTTITIMLCAIRNAFRKNGWVSLSKGVHNFIEKPDINNKPRYILKTETSYPYLQEHIQKDGTPDEKVDAGAEEVLLQNAFEYFIEKINESNLKEEAFKSFKANKKKDAIRDKLISIRDKILKLKLIFITLDSEDDAYIIFETLNTRGKDLRISDLVKNHITKLLKPKNVGVDIPKERWNKIAELIDASPTELDVDVFIHYFWLSKYNFIPAKKLFKEIKKNITKRNVRPFLQELNDDARTFREINETTYRTWAKNELGIKDSLNSINLFRVKQAMPMLISVMREYKKRAIKLEAVLKILKSIECFHFIFTAITSQRSSGGISFMYAKSARELLDATSLVAKNKIINDLRLKLRDKLPNYQEFEANFSELGYSDEYTKQKKLVQYVLAKIDAFNAGGLSIDYNKMTIEHIASQNTENQKLAPEKIASLGNLLLVNEPLNSKLANKPFHKKKEIIGKSRIFLDKILQNTNTWDVQKIDERTKELARLAYEKVWKI